MNGQPTKHTARSCLQTERQPYNRETVRAIAPDGHGVYAIWCSEYECLYIGKSDKGNSVKSRLLDHLSDSEPNIALRRAVYRNRDIAEFAYCLTNSPEWANELEGLLIKHYQPVHNNRRL